MVEPLMYVEAENIGDELHKVFDIVSYSSVAASSKCENDGIYGHTCKDPYTDEWLDAVNVLND